MNAPASVASTEKPVPVTLAAPTEGKHSAAKGSAVSHHAKNVHVDTDAERMRSTLVRMTANSVDELDSLFSELQEVRDYLKSEGERVQREVANYAQLNQSALAAIKIITETIGPWKSTALDSDTRNSGEGVAPPVGGLRAPGEQTKS
jgi:chemotaxis protein histidine kinase CheA